MPKSAGRPSPGAPGTASTTAAAAAPRPPVVRLRPVTAAPVQRLPATSRPPQPSPAQQPAVPAATVSSGAPALVVSRALPTGHATTATRAANAAVTPPAPPSPATARLLQRVAEQNGLTGVPLTAVPARTPTTVQRAAPSPAASTAATTPGSAPGGPPAASSADPADLDELARRLVEPVGRLLRTELRRGRERGGKPYDMRR
ncbi:hypothetical protein [Kitasatospora xanthocidica]|uniref:hypothetical protein n=1 Tax=Kitasatospora xanthocidica TaxID=83382 RepID=UPI0015F3417E|nr:hypothetical protein [Kitasatospora xanthocidica]